jgi:hypothetical protein
LKFTLIQLECSELNGEETDSADMFDTSEKSESIQTGSVEKVSESSQRQEDVSSD